MDGYLGVSCVGVTDDFKPFHCVLACKKMEGRHTATAIIAEYEAVLEAWRLQNKVLKFNID